MRIGHALGVALAALACSLTAASHADVRAAVPGGGGLAAMDVRLDLARGVVVVAESTEVPIGAPPAELAPESDAVVESVDIGRGRHVAHVRVPLRESDRAWEAVLAAGHPEPLFAGITGFVEGDPGERQGKRIEVVAGGAASYLLLGEIREDCRICGQAATLLDPQALYPESLSFRTATVQRLTAAQREGAVHIDATAHGVAVDAPLASLLVARGSSVPGSRGGELTDGDPSTSWRELRPGAGQGEFVVMSAPRDVRIPRMQFVTPTAGAGSLLVSPRTFYVVTSAVVYEILLPEVAARASGEVFEVTFPTPLETACVTLVLGDAYTRGLARPDVALSEVIAYSEFDAAGATLDDVASRLSGDRGGAAAQVLERAGPRALASVEKAYVSLDAAGRAFAVDVGASQSSCVDAAPMLARALCDRGEASRKAREKLERCPGAAPLLAARMREDPASRACIGPLLATLSPADAIAPVADALGAAGEGEHEQRRVLRDALGRALEASAPGTLASLLRDAGRPAFGRLEILRAAGDHAAEARPEAEALLGELLAGAPTLRVRYLAVGPLAVLARAGDAAAKARVLEAVTRDPDWPVRAAAAEAAAGLPGASGPLVAAARDPEPRVREVAVGALASMPSPGSVAAATAALAYEPFTFVKLRAIAAVDAGPTSDDANRALAGALGDASAAVRGAAVTALGDHRGWRWKEAIRARLEDPDEDVDVRAAAATSLGRSCDSGSVDRLAQLARALAMPGVRGVDGDAQAIGMGALAGLAALHPTDLRERLAPLLAASSAPSARAAAGRALETPGSCR
jgi:HEAT repeat protein